MSEERKPDYTEIARQLRLALTTSDWTTPELDEIIQAGVPIDDIILRVHRDRLPSSWGPVGKIRTKYGLLRYRVSKKGEGFNFTPLEVPPAPGE